MRSRAGQPLAESPLGRRDEREDGGVRGPRAARPARAGAARAAVRLASSSRPSKVLAEAPALHPLWVPALLSVAPRAAAPRVTRGPASPMPHPQRQPPQRSSSARPVLGTGLFLAEARKHTRLAELIRVGTAMVGWRWAFPEEFLQRLLATVVARRCQGFMRPSHHQAIRTHTAALIVSGAPTASPARLPHPRPIHALHVSLHRPRLFAVRAHSHLPLPVSPGRRDPSASGPDAPRARHHALPAPVRPLPGLTPAPRAVLAALAAVRTAPLFEHTTTFPLSAHPVFAPLVNALMDALALYTPLPALWAPALLRVCLGEEVVMLPPLPLRRSSSYPVPFPLPVRATPRPVLGRSLSLAEAHKHARLAELIPGHPPSLTLSTPSIRACLTSTPRSPTREMLLPPITLAKPARCQYLLRVCEYASPPSAAVCVGAHYVFHLLLLRPETPRRHEKHYFCAAS
ncbi:hypothetical protein FB451DRAFT_1553122 [Mycena latifolia]|nr:hypothetical protein FB451DRAFT_1553122 [Mycena latifolia]